MAHYARCTGISSAPTIPDDDDVNGAFEKGDEGKWNKKKSGNNAFHLADSSSADLSAV